jgi:hypothetical protein
MVKGSNSLGTMLVLDSIPMFFLNHQNEFSIVFRAGTKPCPTAENGASFVCADLDGARRVIFQAPALAQRTVAYLPDLQPQAQTGLGPPDGPSSSQQGEGGAPSPGPVASNGKRSP